MQANCNTLSDTNRDCYADSDCNSNAYGYSHGYSFSDTYVYAYANTDVDPMHGQMHTDAEAASYSRTAPLSSNPTVLFRQV